LTLLEKIKKGLISGFHTASDITSEYTKIGRIKIDIVGIKKEIEEKMLELGGRIYENYTNTKSINFKNKEQIIKILNDISSLEIELKKSEIRLNEIKKLNETSIDDIKS
jgi:hypothetical protein